MASVFKTKGRDGKRHKIWRFKYRDVTGKWVYGTGWPGKKKTLNHVQALEAEHRAVRNGEKDVPPSWLRERNKPIAEIIAEYLGWGKTQGGRGGRPWAKALADNRRRHLDMWVDVLGLKTLGEIDLARVEEHTRTLFKAGNKGKTVASKIEALKALCFWCVKHGYLARSPLQAMAAFDIRPTKPHRALTPDEIRKLFAHTPANRQLWYKVALATGYRLSECAALKVRNLDVFGPSLPLAADFTKNRKDARQPIGRELADELAVNCAGRSPEDSLLDMPKKNTTGVYLGTDFTAAKIERVSTEGKATFHSFRVNFINAVIESGADLKTVMELARHGSAAMSMEVYAKAKPERLRAAAEAAQNQMQEQIDAPACCTGVAQAKTGTDDVPVSNEGESALPVSNLVSGPGFEPGMREPKTLVLPLHHPEMMASNFQIAESNLPRDKCNRTCRSRALQSG